MKHELTITTELESRCSQARVAKQFTALFEFGTIRESIADVLQLRDDPRLVAVSVQSKQKRIAR
jgi:hypothetical protein